MNYVVLNRFISCYLMYYLSEALVYIVICNCFKLKISTKKAYLIGFLCANFVAITSTLSMLIIASGRIMETPEVLLFNKVILCSGELLLIAFCALALDIAWYRSYWITIAVHFLLFPAYYAYDQLFIEQGTEPRFSSITPISIELLPKYLFVLMIGIALLCLFLALSKYVQRIKKIYQISNRSWIVIYSIWAIVIALLTKSFQGSDNIPSTAPLDHFDNFFEVSIVLIAFAIVIYSSINHADKRLLQTENILLKEQGELQYAHYLAMQERELEIHKLYHDIGNHIKTIHILVDNCDNQAAKEYTKALSKQYQDIRKNFYCNNKIINAVVSQKAEVCSHNGISYDVDIKVPAQISIRDIDIMSVYSNLLDNAIESCQRNESVSNYIKIKTTLVGGFLAVKIINSKAFSNPISKSKKRFVTWKCNKSMHGYGLKIIEEIVERYDGQQEIQDNGTEFSALIMLKA